MSTTKNRDYDTVMLEASESFVKRMSWVWDIHSGLGYRTSRELTIQFKKLIAYRFASLTQLAGVSHIYIKTINKFVV